MTLRPGVTMRLCSRGLSQSVAGEMRSVSMLRVQLYIHSETVNKAQWRPQRLT